jgi:hypothetical protein
LAADPLACNLCGGQLRIISLIENPAVIEEILRSAIEKKHLGNRGPAPLHYVF